MQSNDCNDKITAKVYNDHTKEEQKELVQSSNFLKMLIIIDQVKSTIKNVYDVLWTFASLAMQF